MHALQRHAAVADELAAGHPGLGVLEVIIITVRRPALSSKGAAGFTHVGEGRAFAVHLLVVLARRLPVDQDPGRVEAAAWRMAVARSSITWAYGAPAWMSARMRAEQLGAWVVRRDRDLRGALGSDAAHQRALAAITVTAAAETHHRPRAAANSPSAEGLCPARQVCARNPPPSGISRPLLRCMRPGTRHLHKARAATGAVVALAHQRSAPRQAGCVRCSHNQAGVHGDLLGALLQREARALWPMSARYDAATARGCLVLTVRRQRAATQLLNQLGQTLIVDVQHHPCCRPERINSAAWPGRRHAVVVGMVLREG